MAKNSSNRSAPPRKGSSLLVGIIVGMVFGLAIAAGVAWYILKTPNPFVSKESHEAARPGAAKPAPMSAPEVAAASGVGEGRPRFEFYKVLTDKQDAAVPVQQKGSDKPVAAESKSTSAKPAEKTAANETYFLQAGAFSNADDADKLKAKLAMLGMEASIQTVTIPDKGVCHRVRLGPYKGADEMNKILAALKQNGVEATPMKAQ